MGDEGGMNMTIEAQTNGTYNLKEEGVLGDIQIADDVIAIIAGLAATEVEGVAKMYGNITNELVSKLGMKNLSKGVKVMRIKDDERLATLSIVDKYIEDDEEQSAEDSQNTEVSAETSEQAPTDE